MIKFTKEELNKMSDKQLLSLDITTKEEEAIIQEIRNSRITPVTNVVKFDNSKVPDFKSPQEESEYQKKIDEFYKQNIPVEAQIAQAKKALELINTEVGEVTQTPTVAQVQEVVEQIQKIEPTIVPFCDSCDSKGVSHKKVCPKNPKNLIVPIQPTTETK